MKEPVVLGYMGSFDVEQVIQELQNEPSEIVIRISQSGHTTVTQTKKIRLHVERN